jgi:uncharacterized protein (TIGR00369 family)
MSAEAPGGRAPVDLAAQNAILQGHLPAHLGVVLTHIENGLCQARLEIQPHHMAPNGFLHAATVVALADTAAGLGCRNSLPEGASGFTTTDLNCSYMGTATEGALACDARMVHGGRTTQVWQVEVRREGANKVLAIFRCTQLVLYRRTA